MPVRLRITLLFALLVFIILSIVCTGIYYFSYTARLDTIKKRLTNRAITTARLLSQKEIFDQKLVQRIDSLTTIALTNKTVQAYNYKNNKIYNYSDLPGDTLNISNEILDNTRFKGNIYFSVGNKEAIAFHYVDNKSRIVIISAGEDEDGRETLNRLLKILVISFLIGNIFVLGVGYLFSRGLLQPIRKITDDVAEISAQNLTRRIQTGPTKDEWYHLSHTLNDLLDRLQESFELQRRFISNASHELSTPLTSISSQLEVSLQKERVAEDYKKVMQSIYQDVRHMSNLTQTLLEFAKASGNTGGLEINLVRMDEIILQLPAEIVKINNAYSIILQFDDLPEDEENLLVFGNETLLLTAIKNIVVNACKYSENHQATVHLKMQDQSILIIIEDQGAGIPKEELAKIFQPFYRVEEHRTTGGFGLGLSLAERIIKLHKGTIEVASEKGKGTTFYISLPPARNLGSI
jgi:two-component system, OmpR family, sensor histidine kinase ArlS